MTSPAVVRLTFELAPPAEVAEHHRFLLTAEEGHRLRTI
jgi:hypothetical protein